MFHFKLAAVKRLPFMLTIGLLLFLGIIVITYNFFSEKGSVSVWSIIPRQAVLVFEAGECESCIEQIKSTPFWEVINQNLILNKPDDSISKVLNGIFDSKSNVFVSLHLTQKDEFDLVFYLPKNKAEQVEQDLFKLSRKNVKFSQREFSGLQINELNLSGRLFSWISFEEYWAGSFKPFLIEDVIRAYKSQGRESFGQHASEMLQLPNIKNDAGNVYLNLGELNGLLSVFLDKSIKLPGLGHSSLLDVKQGKNYVTLNGFSLARKNQLLSYFKNQTPVSFNSKQFISNRSIIVTNFGISDGKKLFQELDVATNKVIQDSIYSLAHIEVESLFSGLGKEITLCLFETRGFALSKVLLFDTQNTREWLTAFDLLSKAAEREDSLYFERYSSYEIREIEIRNLPEKLFKPLITGFQQMYYTHINSLIIISEQVEELRRFLDDIDKEEVLGKSVAFNQFLESTLLESNVSIYVNTPRAMGVMPSRLNQKWKSVYTSTKGRPVSSLGFSAFQFSHLNESFYTNLTWSFDSEKRPQLSQQQPLNRVLSNIENHFVSRPFVVRNHATKREEFVVQDSLHQIHYFGYDGKHQWKRDVGGKFSGNLYQLDYLNNNKLQLFFFANEKLHVIDRLGNYVNPFPLSIPAQHVEYVSLIDYDNSKRYRYLLADRTGKLWLYDKEGNNLDGWKPRNVEGPLFTRPDHHRIRGKDFIVAIRKDGWVYLMNRRGEHVKGFPLQLDIKPEGSYFLEPGNSMAATYFVVVSKDGVKVKFNVEGKIISREALIKAAIDDQFSLLAEHHGKSYLISRQNSRQLTLLDESGKPFLSNDFVSARNAEVQYYDFGGGRSYVLIADRDQDLCYVYGSQGNLLTSTPLESSGVSLKLDAEKALLAYVNGKTFILESLTE
jgi:hypothetical protein